MKTSLLVPIVILCISGCPNKPFSTKPGGIEEPMGDLRTYMSANALIGSWGQKTGTYKKLYQIGLKRNGFQRSGIGDWNNVGIIEIASFDIDSENRKNIEKLGLEYKELVEASTSLSRARTDKYKVVFVQVADFGDLVKAIKERIIKDPDSDFSFNIKNNADFRVIVTSGFVMSHKHANELRSSINAGGTLTKIKGTSIGVKASADSKASVIISDNTIVAYQFARPCWDNEANLRALAIDKKGIDESECPNGTTSKHPKRLK